MIILFIGQVLFVKDKLEVTSLIIVGMVEGGNLTIIKGLLVSPPSTRADISQKSKVRIMFA